MQQAQMFFGGESHEEVRVMKKLVLMLVVSSLLVVGSVGQAVVIMDATLHNGGFTAESAGFWYNTPTAIPTGWAEVDRYMYTTGTLWVQCGSTATAINNTGEVVAAGQQFTVSADMGGGEGIDATVRVYATQNADGTGTKVELANVHRFGIAGDGYNLFNVVGTQGAAAAAGLAGYFIQVQIGGPYVDHYIAGYYDNVVVTATPEPATLALLGLGGLFLRKRK